MLCPGASRADPVLGKRGMRTDLALVRGVSASWTKALSRAGAELSLERAREEHAEYVAVLRQCVDAVVEVPAHDDMPDCCFIEDCAVAIGGAVLLTSPGAASRRLEPPALAAVLAALRGAPRRVAHMPALDPAARLDGGDVLHTERHCFVGLSSRTNAAGLAALRAALGPELPGGPASVFGIEVPGAPRPRPLLADPAPAPQTLRRLAFSALGARR